jgi:zinc transporter ZupT
MRLNSVLTGFALNFFLGVAWAAVLIGIIISFFTYYDQSIVFAILACFIGALPGLFVVLVLEHVVTTKEKLQELQKHTKMSEEYHEKKLDELRKQTEILQKFIIEKEKSKE